MTTAPSPDDAARDARRRKAVVAAAAYAGEWMAFQRDLRGVPGVQAAIRYRGELVLDAAWGVADVVSGAALTSDHLFRIASHSKTFTATAVLQLADAGRLRLDDAVATWVPELAGAEIADVTVRELLGHQAGVIRDGVDADYWQRGFPFPDREALIEIAKTQGRVFDRNEHFKYSNIGYSLLGLVIEAASGSSYAAYVDAAIIQPLGVRDLGPEYDPARADEFAAGHTGALQAGAARRRIPHVDTRAMASATGWFGTARDVTAYLAAHAPGDETLLVDASKRLMQRRESAIEYAGATRHYGLGIDVRDLDESVLVGHSGGYPGHITRTWLDTEDELVVSVLTNAIDGPADVLATGAMGILKLALAHAESDPVEPVYAGRYASLWGVTDLVELGGDVFVLHPADPDPSRAAEQLDVDEDGALRMAAKDGFGGTGEPVAVRRDDDGSVRGIVVNGMSMWPIEDYRYALTTEQPSALLGGMSI